VLVAASLKSILSPLLWRARVLVRGGKAKEEEGTSNNTIISVFFCVVQLEVIKEIKKIVRREVCESEKSDVLDITKRLNLSN
jgi:hypothetical protein